MRLNLNYSGLFNDLISLAFPSYNIVLKALLKIRGVSDVGFSIFADTDADADFAF